MTEHENESAALSGRGVIEITGPDRKDFLQGLLTNDINSLSPGHPLYAAMLTPQGKYLFDFLIFEDGETLFLDCEKARAADLLRRLTMYKLRARVDLADASDRWTVIAAWGSDAVTPPEGCIAAADPRHPDLGLRILCPAEGVADLSPGDEAGYDAHRLALGIPDGPRDFEVEKLLILEGNVAELNGVSFKKGCYVGQELTARMNYRGKVRKRLLPVTVDGALPDPGTAIVKDGKQLGNIRSGQDGRAIALLRIEDIEDGGTYDCGDARVTVHIPEWLRAQVKS